MSLFDNLPEDANKLDPKSIITTRIVFGIVSIFPIILGIVAYINSGNWYPLFIMIAIAIAFFMLGWIWSKRSYHYARWWFSDEGVYIQRGVFWRKRVLVPQNRVQHTDVSQGPLERKYGLGKLIIHTAGTKDASVNLKGISLETANQLRAQLIDDDPMDAV